MIFIESDLEKIFTRPLEILSWPLNVQNVQEFKEKCPNADITKFTFNVDLDRVEMLTKFSLHICLATRKITTLHPTRLKTNMSMRCIGHRAFRVQAERSNHFFY